ncbi:MAG: hypothetical protein A4E72_00369 [Syntrophus sp. PtaU1.Bin208]|nr:MAG: hypothetical protein A4E72_00369 [Syntrophus sp. PtaU1.Bin208]
MQTMIKQKEELLKKLGLTEEEVKTRFKPVDPSEERIIDGLERLFEELMKEEEQEDQDQTS